MMRVVVLQADGLADESVADLGGKTPLEVARTPHLDRMAAYGILGLTRMIPRGCPKTGDVAMLSVLGYDPARHRPPSAAAAVLGRGVEFGAEDIAFSCELVEVEAQGDGTEVLRESGVILTAEDERELMTELARALGREGLELYTGFDGCHVLLWRRGEDQVRTKPAAAAAGRPVAVNLPAGSGAAVLRELMERSRAVLRHHAICRARRERGEPAPTQLWFSGPTRRPTLPTLRERFGVDGVVVSPTPMVRGICRLVGLSALDVSAEQALASLGEREFLLVQVPAVAEGTDAAGKVEALERFDAELVGPIIEQLRAAGGEWRLLVLPSAMTPLARGVLTDDPVPFAVHVAGDVNKTRGANRGFSEREARDHGVFIPEGHTLMERLLRR